MKAESISMHQLVRIYLMFAISGILLASNAHSKCVEIESAEVLMTQIITIPALHDLKEYHNTIEATAWDEDGYPVWFRSTSEHTYFETLSREENRFSEVGYWFNGKLYETHSLTWGYDKEIDYRPLDRMDIEIMDNDNLVSVAVYMFNYDREKHRYDGYVLFRLGQDKIKKKFKYEDEKTYECDAE